MITRRLLFGALTSLPFIGKAFATSEPVQNRGCFVPNKFKDLRWHVIKSHYDRDGFEVAEWINDPKNGPDGGHWVRWGYCGDFPSLCQADYIGPIGLISQLGINVVDDRKPMWVGPVDYRYAAYLPK